MSSNWQKLQSKLQTTEKTNNKRKHDELSHSKAFSRNTLDKNVSNTANKSVENQSDQNNYKTNDVITNMFEMQKNIPDKIKAKYVGVDCEMVGIGSSGKCSVLARCCVVDFDGNTLYDRFVRPKEFVTDFRTQYSGVRKQDLRHGHAVTLEECQNDVNLLLKNKIMVGHGLSNDLKVLLLSHAYTHIRDTARYKPYMRPHGRKGGKFKPRALRDLTKQHLKMSIQTGEHDPSVDARCAMFLYRLKMNEWEQSIRELKAKKYSNLNHDINKRHASDVVEEAEVSDDEQETTQSQSNTKNKTNIHQVSVPSAKKTTNKHVSKKKSLGSDSVVSKKMKQSKNTSIFTMENMMSNA